MADTLAAIGFNFEDATEFQAGMLSLADASVERLACAIGDYAIWRSRTGAEIWFHLAPAERVEADDAAGADATTRDIVGLTPFIEGADEVEAEIVALVRGPDDSPFEGGFRALLISGAMISFEAVDFAAHSDRPLPFRGHVRLAGFATRVSSLARGHPANPKRESGLGQCDEQPESRSASATPSEISISGSVGDHGRPINEVTGSPFNRLRVETEGYDIVAVAPPSAIEGTIEVGSTVEIECRLVGRVTIG